MRNIKLITHFYLLVQPHALWRKGDYLSPQSTHIYWVGMTGVRAIPALFHWCKGAPKRRLIEVKGIKLIRMTLREANNLLNYQADCASEVYDSDFSNQYRQEYAKRTLNRWWNEIMVLGQTFL